jgi:hypothetical protein
LSFFRFFEKSGRKTWKRRNWVFRRFFFEYDILRLRSSSKFLSASSLFLEQVVDLLLNPVFVLRFVTFGAFFEDQNHQICQRIDKIEKLRNVVSDPLLRASASFTKNNSKDKIRITSKSLTTFRSFSILSILWQIWWFWSSKKAPKVTNRKTKTGLRRRSTTCSRNKLEALKNFELDRNLKMSSSKKNLLETKFLRFQVFLPDFSKNEKSSSFKSFLVYFILFYFTHLIVFFWECNKFLQNLFFFFVQMINFLHEAVFWNTF